MDWPRPKGLRVGCAPDTFLGGGHQTARKADRRRAPSARRSPAPPSSCARATSAGIRRPASTICAAAGRCSTWGPTTSPTCPAARARSRSVMGSAAAAAARAPDHQRAAERHADPGRGRDPRRRHAGVRQRRGGLDRDELRRAQAPARADRDLRHRGQHRWCRTRTGSAARSSVAKAGGEWQEVPHHARPCRRQVPLDRRRRHGGRDRARTGRTAPAARWRCTCWR